MCCFSDEMAQITEAQAIADSFQELALVSQDSQGDTYVHVEALQYILLRIGLRFITVISNLYVAGV